MFTSLGPLTVDTPVMLHNHVHLSDAQRTMMRADVLYLIEYFDKTPIAETAIRTTVWRTAQGLWLRGEILDLGDAEEENWSAEYSYFIECVERCWSGWSILREHLDLPDPGIQVLSRMFRESAAMGVALAYNIAQLELFHVAVDGAMRHQSRVRGYVLPVGMPGTGSERM